MAPPFATLRSIAIRPATRADTGHQPDSRRAARDLVDLVSHASIGARSYGIRIINLSPLGLMCRTSALFTQEARVRVWLPHVGDLPAEVRWVEDGRAGMEFPLPIAPGDYAALLAQMPPRITHW